MGRACVLFMVGAILSLAWAQDNLCESELRAAMQQAGPEAPQLATALVRTAFEALEPAFPGFHRSRDWQDANATWLDARGILPDQWSEVELTKDTWTTLLQPLHRTYGADAPEVTGDLTPESLLQDTFAALTAGAAAVRPLGLIASHNEGGDRVSFGAVIWNWTPVPRLLLFPVRGQSLDDGRPSQALLANLGTCAWHAQLWMAARDEDVRSYYLGNVESGVRILARDEESLFFDVTQEEQADVFQLTDDRVREAQTVSIAFTGPGPSVGQVFRLLFGVKSNVTVLDLPYYLAIP